MNSRKIIIVVLVVIVSIGLIINTHKNLEGTNVEKIEEKTKSLFAIKVENESGKYEDSTKFPGAGYSINTSLTECVDQMGNNVDGVSFSSDGTSVIVTSKYNVYCTLYFSKQSLGQFCNDQTNMETCMNNKKSTIGTIKNVTSNEVGRMYRYQGTDNVNNYICFGTKDKEKCTSTEGIDKYMYRIIGVTDDGQLALIKETGVKEIESTKRVFYWNNKFSKTDCGEDGSKCNWINSRIFNRINGLCNASNQTGCKNTTAGSNGDTNIFIGNSYYEYLTNESIWLDKISNHTWKYGDTTSDGNYNGNTVYSIESQFPNSIEAKIGLQYIHDYYYAYPGGNPESGTNAKDAWIHLSRNGNSEISYDWLISKYGVSGIHVRAWDVLSNGDVNDYDTLYNGRGVRPVFYLTSNIKLSNTTGSKEDPFIINPEPEIMKELRKNDNNNNLTNDLVGDMYRYQGTDNVNNWICFGTTKDCSKTEEDIDKYMYRIIGVTDDGQLALIKETFIKEETEIWFQWNDKTTTADCGEDGSKCTWANSKLFNRLNGLCTSSNGNCTGAGEGRTGQTNIFINSSYYDYLKDNTWLEKINTHTWKSGYSNGFGDYNGDTAYSIESQFLNSIEAKIGLQYIHDYYYAYPGGKPGSVDNDKNTWIYLQKDNYNVGNASEWLITNYGISGTYIVALLIENNGYISNDYLLNRLSSVRPVFYLTPDITFKEGTTGEKDNPFILDL